MLPAKVKPGKWDMNVTTSEANNVLAVVLRPLVEAQAEASSTHKWKLVDTSTVMPKHGWCVGPPAKFLAPRSVGEWDAYADTGRRIRTANDSLLTQWAFSKATSFRTDWLSGVFHPTALAHAEIADRVFATLATTGGK